MQAGPGLGQSGAQRDTAVRVRREVGSGGSEQRGSTSLASRKKIPQNSGLSPQHSRTPDFYFYFIIIIIPLFFSSMCLCVSSPPPPGPGLCVYFLPGKLVSDREGGREDRRTGRGEGGRPGRCVGAAQRISKPPTRKDGAFSPSLSETHTSFVCTLWSVYSSCQRGRND